MAKIALVDDDRNILTSVSIMLEAEGFDVKTFRDGQSAFKAFDQSLPDLALLDIKMPRMDGLHLLEKIRKISAMPVIFLTSKDDEVDEVLGLRLGADDYITKPFSPRLLLARIDALLRRQKTLGEGRNTTDQIIERGALQMDPCRHHVAWKGCKVLLTVTEFLLLQTLAERPGFVKSRDQLMDAAYGEQIYADDRTIDSHIKRLRRKLRMVDENFTAIETIYGIGYRYRND